MPPVFGPWSPSRARLKSCAGSSGTAVTPSVTANRDTSGPSRNSSITTVPQSLACRRAAEMSAVTRTPLPAASASSLTTYGGPNAASAASASAAVRQVNDAAVGMPASAITCLAKDLEPSIMAAWADGPKQAMPASRSASAAPATSGASGPITTRSGPSLRANARIASGDSAVSGWTSASSAMPGLPGAACTSEGLSARTIACSRPPDPMTSIRMALKQRPELQGLVAAGADADRGHRGADHLLDGLDVGARVRRQVLEGACLGDVLRPAVEVLIDRHRVVELGLRHRDLVVADPVHLVGHADRHPVQAGQHVQLGEEVAGDPVHPGRVPGDDGVEPAAAARPAGGHALLVAQFGGERTLADPGRVRLDDADDRGDPGRADAGADAGAARGRRGRGHERVGPVVHVQHGGLRALEQNHLALIERPAEDQAGVRDVGPEAFGVALVVGGGGGRVD